MRHRTFSRAVVTSLREMPIEHALALLAVYHKADSAYVPIRDARSRRWHARTVVGEFEILTTEPHKWYDTRGKIGGGGAIDLAMHLLQLSFVDAVKLLKERRRSHG